MKLFELIEQLQALADAGHDSDEVLMSSDEEGNHIHPFSMAGTERGIGDGGEWEFIDPDPDNANEDQGSPVVVLWP